MDNTNLTENLDMLNKIYGAREEELGKLSNDLKEKLNDITVEEVQDLIEKKLRKFKGKRKSIK